MLKLAISKDKGGARKPSSGPLFELQRGHEDGDVAHSE